MECKQIQDLLLSDFADGELSSQLEIQVKSHLSSCVACRVFEQEVRKTAEPFQNIAEVRPPERVWENIQRSLREEETARAAPGLGLTERFQDLVRGLLSIPRPAYWAVMACAVLLVGLTWGGRSRQSTVAEADRFLEEQVEFVLGLDSEQEDDILANDLEQYI